MVCFLNKRGVTQKGPSSDNGLTGNDELLPLEKHLHGYNTVSIRSLDRFGNLARGHTKFRLDGIERSRRSETIRAKLPI